MSSNSMCELGPNARASSSQNVETAGSGSTRGNASQAEQPDIDVAVARRRQAQWLSENRNALDSSNTLVEQHGLPLATFRRF